MVQIYADLILPQIANVILHPASWRWFNLHRNSAITCAPIFRKKPIHRRITGQCKCGQGRNFVVFSFTVMEREAFAILQLDHDDVLIPIAGRDIFNFVILEFDRHPFNRAGRPSPPWK